MTINAVLLEKEGREVDQEMFCALDGVGRAGGSDSGPEEQHPPTHEEQPGQKPCLHSLVLALPSR